MIDFSEISLGKVIVYNDKPCVITKCDFSRMQQRKPVKKCTLKNLMTGNSYDYSFKSGESVEEADMEKVLATFIYKTNDSVNFMRSDTYESIDVNIDLLSDKVDYLKEGLEMTLLFFNGEIISVELPVKVSYKIVETNEVEKGNTVQGVLKDAVIETGKVVKVPSFIKVGEKVIINTVENQYTERDTSK